MTIEDLQKLFPNATKDTWHQHPNGGGWVENTAQVDDSSCVSGSARVYGSAQVFGYAWVSVSAHVYGSAHVSGSASVYGYAKVYEGEWVSSPLYLQGSKYSVCRCSKSNVMIGCEDHSIDEWLSRYSEIGRDNGYSEEEIEEYGLYLELFSEIIEKKSR